MMAEFFLGIPQKTPFVAQGRNSYPLNRVPKPNVKERMMNSKKAIVMGCVITLSAIPAIGMAKTEAAGLSACASAMMSDLALEENAHRPYEVKNLKPGSSRRLGFSSTYHLDARGTESHKVLARYDCVVNAKAEVIELTELPIEAEDARDRAFSMN
jgi:hypothetical protein